MVITREEYKEYLRIKTGKVKSNDSNFTIFVSFMDQNRKDIDKAFKGTNIKSIEL